MGANKLVKLIENSKNRITMPNDCYNSGIINAKFSKTSGIPKVENIQISICYGKPKHFIFWKDGKEMLHETISTSKIVFENDVFKTKFYTIKIT